MSSGFLDLIDEYKCDGVVFHQAMTCRTIHTGQLNQINTFRKFSDKPVLLLEGDIVDARNYDERATHVKIDAFIDVVDNHKRSLQGKRVGAPRRCESAKRQCA